MKISARNKLRGKLVEVRKGQTTAHLRLDIGNGVTVTASITNEAVDELGLAVGQAGNGRHQGLRRDDRDRLIR